MGKLNHVFQNQKLPRWECFPWYPVLRAVMNCDVCWPLYLCLKVDEFLIEAVSLKTLEKVRVGHDSTGPGSGWFLDKVVIKDPEDNTKEYVFPCNRFVMNIYHGNLSFDWRYDYVWLRYDYVLGVHLFRGLTCMPYWPTLGQGNYWEAEIELTVRLFSKTNRIFGTGCIHALYLVAFPFSFESFGGIPWV